MQEHISISKKHAAQNRPHLDRSGVQGQESRGLARLFDPVNMTLEALLEKRGDAKARLGNTTSHFLELNLEKFVVVFAHQFRNTRLQSQQTRREHVGREIGVPDAIFTAFFEIASLFDLPEEFVDFVDHLSGQNHARGIACDREQTLLGAGRIIQALDGRAQAVLRNADPDMPRRHRFDGVSLIKNNEIVREKKSGFTAACCSSGLPRRRKSRLWLMTTITSAASKRFRACC